MRLIINTYDGSRIKPVTDIPIVMPANYVSQPDGFGFDAIRNGKYVIRVEDIFWIRIDHENNCVEIMTGEKIK